MTKHFVLGLLTVLLAMLTLQHKPATDFTFDDAEEVAKDRAHGRFSNREERAALPLALHQLNYDEYRKLRWKNEYTLWRKEGFPFQLRFFHRGHLFTDRVEIATITPKGVVPLHYDRRFFDTSDIRLPELGNIGYAGFRIHYPINRPDYLDEVAVFLGGSYFRAVSRDLNYGISARGIAVNTGIQGVDEEFPVFREFWVRRPGRFSKEIQFYAVLDGKSLTGAYDFRVQPGLETVMKVHAKLFIKAPIQRLGIAPLTSMFWYGENTPDANRDWRPEVHDSDGLLMQTGSGEWLWRPLNYGATMRENRFAEPNIRGFGLLQRDRDFQHYQDLEAKYHMRPSAWVETVRGFENGAVELVQLPTSHEYQDNIVAFWTPNQTFKTGDTMEFEYTLYWYGSNAQRPPLGYATQTIVQPSDNNNSVRYFVDFAGGPVSGLNEAPQAVIIPSPAQQVSDIQVQKNDYDNSWRLGFSLNAPQNRQPVEIRALLSRNGQAVTETWTYTWNP